MKRKLLLSIVAIICLAAAWGFHLYTQKRTDTSRITSAATITAEALYQQYQQNEALADKQYTGKVITVKGTVAESTGTDAVLSISLYGSAAGNVNCSFSAVSKNSIVPAKGNTLLIKGKCTGFLADVNLVDCVVLND